MALADFTHHTAPRGHSMARAGRVEREDNNEPRPLDPPLLQAAGVQHFFLDDDESFAAGSSRPDRLLAASGPQERALRHTVEQLADCVTVVPLLDSPVPQVVDQLVDVLKFFNKSLAEQVVEVPKIALQDGWRNSWWKCQRSPFSSSRPLAFQFRVVVGVVEVFKVSSQDRVFLHLAAEVSKVYPQDRFPQHMTAEVFKVSSQDRVQQHMAVEDLKVYLQDRVLQRSVELLVQMCSRDRVQQLLVELIISVSSPSGLHQRLMEHIILVNKVSSQDRVQLRFLPQFFSAVACAEEAADEFGFGGRGWGPVGLNNPSLQEIHENPRCFCVVFVPNWQTPTQTNPDWPRSSQTGQSDPNQPKPSQTCSTDPKPVHPNKHVCVCVSWSGLTRFGPVWPCWSLVHSTRAF